MTLFHQVYECFMILNSCDKNGKTNRNSVAILLIELLYKFGQYCESLQYFARYFLIKPGFPLKYTDKKTLHYYGSILVPYEKKMFRINGAAPSVWV